MKKITLFLGLALIFSIPTQAQDIVAYWNQNSNELPGGGFGFLADPDSFPQAADLGSGSITVGGGILDETETNGNGDLVYRWIPSFAGTEINAEVGDVSGGSISIQGGTDNANNGSYIQFEFSMTNKENLEISYATRGTASGFTTQTWSWSTNGTDFTDFGTIPDTNVTDFFLVEASAPADLNNAATAFLRVTFDGATTTNGNNRLDNIKLVAGNLSTQSFDKLKVDMYPNPVRNGVVTIKTNSNQPLQVSVFDVLGKQVISKTVSNNTLNVSNLKAGVYLVQVTENNATSTKKLIVN
ncbi:MAG: T9SS type A sorting domain-containing protein [Flavobacteriaceae bacterium]